MIPGCKVPLPLATLEGYWFGELEAPEAERVEEHFFSCDACGARLRALAALGRGVRRLAHDGAVPLVVTAAFLEAASRAGLRTREYSVPAGGRVACTVTPEDDLLVGRMSADFHGVACLDILVEMAGQVVQRIEDAPVSPDARELILLQAMPAARALGRTEMRVRLVSREGDLERVLGDYTFDHTPTPA